MKNNCNCSSSSSSNVASPQAFWDAVRPLFVKYKEPYCLMCIFKQGYSLGCEFCPVMSEGSSFQELFQSKEIKDYDSLSSKAKAELQIFIDCEITVEQIDTIIQKAIAFAFDMCEDLVPKKQSSETGKEEQIKMLKKRLRTKSTNNLGPRRNDHINILADLNLVEMFVGKSYFITEACTPTWGKKNLVFSKKYPLSASYDQMVNELEAWVWSHYSKDKYWLLWVD